MMRYTFPGRTYVTLCCLLLIGATGCQIASSSLGSSASSPTGLTFVAVQASDVAWDRFRHVLYVATTDTAGAGHIDVLSADERSLYSVSAAPPMSLLSLSASGSILYAASSSGNAIDSIAVASWRLLGETWFDTSGTSSSLSALEASPSYNQTVAAVFTAGTDAVSTNTHVVVMTNGSFASHSLCQTEAPQCGSGLLFNPMSLQWNGSGDQLFIKTADAASFGVSAATLDQAGLHLVYGALVPSPTTLGGRLHYDAFSDRLYDDSGIILDPRDGHKVGEFPVSGAMLPDGQSGLAYFVRQVPSGSSPSSLEIVVCNLATQQIITRHALTDSGGIPTRVVMTTDGALVVLTKGDAHSSGGVYVVDSVLSLESSGDAP